MNDFQVGDLVLTPGGYVGEVKEINYTSAPIQYRINTILEKDQKTPTTSENDNDMYYYGLQLVPWANSKEVLNKGIIVKSLWIANFERICIYEYENQFYWVQICNGEVIDYCQLR